MVTVSLGADLVPGLVELRVEAESRMKTTFEFQYKVGTTPDPVTDADVPNYVTAFVTKGRLKSPGNVVHESEVGGRTAAEVSRILSIPVSSADPWADDRAAYGVTALVTLIDPLTDDPSMLGARLTLSGPAPGSQTTARRYEVTEVVS